MGSTLTRDILDKSGWTGITTSGDTNAELLNPDARRRASEVMETLRRESAAGIPVVDFTNGIARFVSDVHREALMRTRSIDPQALPIFSLNEAYSMLLWWFGVDADVEVRRRPGITVTTEWRDLLKFHIDAMFNRHELVSSWVSAALRPRYTRPQETKSLTAPMLMPCVLVSPERTNPLMSLLDYRPEVMIKMQKFTWQRVEELQQKRNPDHPLIGFTLDVLYGRLLRELTTRWPRVVTIHFATCLDAFVAPTMTITATQTIQFKPSTELFLYQVTEHGEKPITGALWDEINDMKAVGKATMEELDRVAGRRLAAWTWMTYFALASAAEFLGLNDLDPHVGNVMVSPTKDRPYHDRVLAYRVHGARTMAELVYLTPEEHGNMMVDIIDFGRMEPRVTALERDRGLLQSQSKRELLAAGFIHDMWYFLTRGEVWHILLNRLLGETLSYARNLLMQSIVWLHEAKRWSTKADIFDKWHTMPMFQDLLVRDFVRFTKAAVAEERPRLKPLLVGYMPDEADVRLTAEQRDPHSLSCVVCQAPATMARISEDATTHPSFHCHEELCIATLNGDLDVVHPRIM
jgi:hypothetical protein